MYLGLLSLGFCELSELLFRAKVHVWLLWFLWLPSVADLSEISQFLCYNLLCNCAAQFKSVLEWCSKLLTFIWKAKTCKTPPRIYGPKKPQKSLWFSIWLLDVKLSEQGRYRKDESVKARAWNAALWKLISASEVKKGKICWKQKQRMTLYVPRAILGLVRANARGQVVQVTRAAPGAGNVRVVLFSSSSLWQRSASISLTLKTWGRFITWF